MDDSLAPVGRALAAPVRAAMVALLLDGQRHAAGELARYAGVGSGTASGHLKVLVASGLVRVRTEGRFRFYEITDGRTARALELLSRPQRARPTSYRLSREQQRVQGARTCYDHLAGRLGVGLAQTLVDQGWLSAGLDEVLAPGVAGLSGWGIDVVHLRRARRPLLRGCLDWTEREDHVAGSVGAALADIALARAWVRRIPNSRGLRLTLDGAAALGALGMSAEALASITGSRPRG